MEQHGRSEGEKEEGNFFSITFSTKKINFVFQCDECGNYVPKGTSMTTHRARCSEIHNLQQKELVSLCNLCQFLATQGALYYFQLENLNGVGKGTKHIAINRCNMGGKIPCTYRGCSYVRNSISLLWIGYQILLQEAASKELLRLHLAVTHDEADQKLSCPMCTTGPMNR